MARCFLAKAYSEAPFDLCVVYGVGVSMSVV